MANLNAHPIPLQECFHGLTRVVKYSQRQQRSEGTSRITFPSKASTPMFKGPEIQDRLEKNKQAQGSMLFRASLRSSSSNTSSAPQLNSQPIGLTTRLKGQCQNVFLSKARDIGTVLPKVRSLPEHKHLSNNEENLNQTNWHCSPCELIQLHMDTQSTRVLSQSPPFYPSLLL